VAQETLDWFDLRARMAILTSRKESGYRSDTIAVLGCAYRRPVGQILLQGRSIWTGLCDVGGVILNAKLQRPARHS